MKNPIPKPKNMFKKAVTPKPISSDKKTPKPMKAHKKCSCGG